MDGADPQSSEPYRPPGEVSKQRAKNSLLEPLTIAYFLWSALALLVIAAGFLMRPMFEDFGVELPQLTLFLLHPMSSVLFMATALTVILSGIAMDSRSKRNRLGRIAMVLGVLAFLACLFALLAPLISLTRSLS